MAGKLNSRPKRYEVVVQLPSGKATLLVEDGFCTRADPALAHWVGLSAAWIKGHLIYQHWPATMRRAPEPETLL